MKKWEYKVLDSKNIPRAGILKGRDRSGVEKYLNNLGREGWELSILTSGNWRAASSSRVWPRERQVGNRRPRLKSPLG